MISAALGGVVGYAYLGGTAVSRFPRRRALQVDRGAGWSPVSETADDHGVVYRVMWSAESWMYLGLCDSHPNLSWQAATEGDALNGIRQQVQQRADLSGPQKAD